MERTHVEQWNCCCPAPVKNVKGEPNSGHRGGQSKHIAGHAKVNGRVDALVIRRLIEWDGECPVTAGGIPESAVLVVNVGCILGIKDAELGDREDNDEGGKGDSQITQHYLGPRSQRFYAEEKSIAQLYQANNGKSVSYAEEEVPD